MFFTASQRAALRACALIMGLLAFLTLVSPRMACAEGFHSDRITVSVIGQGPDVIFIPGLASSSHVWDQEASKLKDHYRVHLVQVAGFAGAPAMANASGPVVQPTVDAIDAYIHSEHLAHPAVVGHSLGGLMGLLLAKQHPKDVGKLMIVDSLPWLGMLAGPGATMAQAEPIGAAMRDKLLAGSQEDYAAKEPLAMARLVKSSGPEAKAAIAAASASDRTVVAKAAYEDMTCDVRADLSAIQTPITLLYPWDASTGVPQAMFDTLYQGAYAAAPHHKAIRIDASYHFIQIDRPEAFDREVKTFLLN